MPDIVEPTIPQYPEQGIQATLDLLYLWNPDAVQPYIEEFERLVEEMRELLENLPEVAVTGSYDDLIDKPAIDGVILTKNTTKEELGLDVDLSAYRTAADQDVIDDRLERLIEGVDDGLTALENVVATKASQAALQEAIANLTNYVDSEITAGLAPVQADITDIRALIPSQASTSNQLADKDFVNSSVATNTAYFIGTFNSVAELEAYSGTLTNNDYAFVIGTDQQGNTVYNRYKYNADTQQWIYEYSLNNSSFTADQWAAVNSSATSAKIEQIETNKQGLANHIADQNNPHAVTKTQVGLGNVDNTADLDKPISTATQTALDAKQDTLVSGTNIKTINGQSVLGEGDIEIKGGVESVNTKTGDVILTGEDILATVDTTVDTVQGHLQSNSDEIESVKDQVSELMLFKFPNATIIGEPTIQNGQVSGFSTASYLQFPFILDLHEQAFQIDMCFTTATNVQTQQNILDSKFGIALAIQNGKGVMAISSNGTSWDIGSATGTMTLQGNTTYYARLTWDRLQYKTFLSTDGVNYTQDMVLVGAVRPFPTTIYIGGCDQVETGHAPHPFLGTINLNKAYLRVMGNVIWQGMDDAGLVTRMDVDASNITEAGKERIKQIVDVPTITIVNWSN